MSALSRFTTRTTDLRWNRGLFLLLLEELSISDEFDEILGRPEDIPVDGYPQAVAVAIALRHSWRADAFERTARVIEAGAKRRDRRK